MSTEKTNLLEEFLPQTGIFDRYLEKDNFIIDLYRYYYGKGYYKILMTEVFSILSFTFVIFFTIFVISWVNYPIRSPSDPRYRGFFTARFSWFVAICIIIAALIITIKLWKFLSDVFGLRKMKKYYNENLGISDYQLISVEWSSIIEKVNIGLSSLDIANIIMRKSNFMMALFNYGIVNTALPFTNIRVYNKTLDWYLEICIIDFIFNGKNIREGFASSHTHGEEILSNNLKRRLFIAGIVHILSLPITLLHTLMDSVFVYGEMYYSDPKELGSRDWTVYAKYKLREYNELQHIFDSRMSICSGYAKKYIHQFPSFHMIPIFKFITMVSTAGILYILVLMCFTSYVTEIVFLGKSMIEYFSILGVIFLVSRGITSSYEDTKVYNPKKYMEKLVGFMHYMPAKWLKDAGEKETLQKVTSYYRYRFMILFNELTGIITAPFILIFSTTKSAEHIVSFVKKNYVLVDEQVGCVCSFANFEKRGNSDEDKLQKSIVNFKANHPAWNAPSVSISTVIHRSGTCANVLIESSSPSDACNFSDESETVLPV